MVNHVHQTEGQSQVPYERIAIPIDWVFAAVMAVLIPFFSVVWWVRGIKSQVDNVKEQSEENRGRITCLERGVESSHTALKKEILLEIKKDIARSEEAICNYFEQSAIEQRHVNKEIRADIVARTQAILAIKEAIGRIGNDAREAKALAHLLFKERKTNDRR